MEYLGFKIINTSEKRLKFPNGKKDGNKLGKRKRSLFYFKCVQDDGVLLDEAKNIIYMNHKTYDRFSKELDKKIKGE